MSLVARSKKINASQLYVSLSHMLPRRTVPGLWSESGRGSPQAQRGVRTMSPRAWSGMLVRSGRKSSRPLPEHEMSVRIIFLYQLATLARRRRTPTCPHLSWSESSEQPSNRSAGRKSDRPAVINLNAERTVMVVGGENIDAERTLRVVGGESW